MIFGDRKKILGLVFVGMTATANADNQAPSIVNGLSATAISSNTARVAWNKPWDDIGVQGYNVYRNGSYFATVFDTNYLDTTVSPNSEYRYRIVAFDAAKNFSPVSNDVSIWISGDNNSIAIAPPAPEPSTGKPTPPDGLFAEVLDGSSVKILWRAPAGTIKGYNVYRDNQYVATVHSPEHTDRGLAWAQNYNYQIVSYDDQQQFSIKSDGLTVNTANNTSNSSAERAAEPTQQVASATASNQSGSVPAGYNLVFAEEFTGYSLDTSKWNSSYRWGPNWIINGERQYYIDRINNPDFGHSPFEFDGDHLTITAIKTPDHLKAQANWQPYLSGALTTYNKFKMRYGYVEMRAKLPKGRGLWSAFWLLHQHDHDRRPEIDVVEYIGQQPNTVFNTYHYYDNWNLRSTPSYEVNDTDYSQDFHTYGMRWEPGKITWYVDGEEKNSFSDGNVSWEEMYLLVNLAVGGWWPGDPDWSTPFPAQYKIDYIRAYQQN